VAQQPWLQLDDELLVDGVDYRVVGVLGGQADRVSFQLLTLTPELGGERRLAMQAEGELREARELQPELLAGEEVEADGRSLHLRWDSDLRTERSVPDKSTQFGRGRCAWYEADDGTVAVLIVERYDRVAFMAAPTDPSRVDLRFTVGLREGR
jgi:hypothetical protein